VVVPISGGTPQQQDLLRQIIAGLPRSQLSELAITSPPEDFEPQDATWLDITVSASNQADGARGFWQALLVVGAFRDESAGRGLPYVAGKSITVKAPDGSVLDGGQSLIDQPLGHDVRPPTDADLTTILRSAASRAKVQLRNVSFAHPLGRTAVELYVTTGDPAGFVLHRQTKLDELVGSLDAHQRPQAEGAYLEVRDSSGRLVTISAYSVRTGEGLGWTEPALQNAAPSVFGFSIG
jgi:hypothetical protein